MKTKSRVTSIDVHVARQLKKKRRELGLSQEALSERIGVTFQQIQKYENAKNRISAGRLHSLSKILGVSIEYFYGDLKEENGLEVVAKSLDQHVAGKIKERRTELNISQQELSRRTHIPPSQLRMYEDEAKPINAFHLLEIASALGVAYKSFYEGFEGDIS